MQPPQDCTGYTYSKEAPLQGLALKKLFVCKLREAEQLAANML